MSIVISKFITDFIKICPLRLSPATRRFNKKGAQFSTNCTPLYPFIENVYSFLLQKLFSLLRFGERAKIFRSHVERGDRARFALLVHAVYGARVREQDARSEFGVGVELQREFHEELIARFRLARAEHHAAVRDAAVVLLQFLLGDEMHRRVVVGKVVGHLLDFLFDARHTFKEFLRPVSYCNKNGEVKFP